MVSVNALWLVKTEAWKLRILILHDDDVSTIVLLRFMDEMMSLLASSTVCGPDSIESPAVPAYHTSVQLCWGATIDTHDHCVQAPAWPRSCIASIVARP